MLTKTATMKPTVTLDEKTGVHVVQQQSPKAVPVKGNWFKYGLLGLVLVFLTTITVFTVLIYGNTKESGKQLGADVAINVNYPTKISTEKSKTGDVEKNVTYHIVPSGEEIKENIVVSGQEESISTPKARMIYDYSRGYTVIKFTDGDDGTCYVNEFNVTGRIDNIKENLVKENHDQFVYSNSSESMYESTDILVNRTLLSPKASEMCTNSKLVMFKKTPATTGDPSKRIERGCSFRIAKSCKTKAFLTYRRTCTRGFWGRLTCSTTSYWTYTRECTTYWYLNCN